MNQASKIYLEVVEIKKKGYGDEIDCLWWA
jgi:hypothetical protein